MSLNRRKGFTIWLTGLSGAGKTTIGVRLQAVLETYGWPVELLDGDAVRANPSSDLTFTKEARDANIRRIGYVAGLLSRNGVAVVVAAISPYRATRAEVRQIITGDGSGFVEVYTRCSLDELSRRDVKGLYARALRGEIANFTGISDPYEEPLTPDVTLDSEHDTEDHSLNSLVAHLRQLGYLQPL